MSYAQVSGHRDMVFDQLRNAAYQRAIETHAGEGRVVLDLGAGLGLHGLMAARAGAARVYLIEPAPVCQLARETACANDLADRMIFLQGKAEGIELPEKVDVIISVFTGNLLFSEDLLPVLFRARDSFLRSGGCLLPDRGELWAVPIMDAALHAEHIGCWSEPCFGFDLQAARRFAANELQWLEPGKSSGARLAEPARLVDLDFATATQADCDSEVSFPVQQTGLCHGILTWIRFRVGNEWLSTDPLSVPMHWSNAVFALDPPLPVEAGEALQFRLQRPGGADWSWRLKARAGVRRHSTFLSRLDNHQRLAAAAVAAMGESQT
jgi:hypothetical protein